MKHFGLEKLVVYGILGHFEIITRCYVLNCFKYTFSEIYPKKVRQKENLNYAKTWYSHVRIPLECHAIGINSSHIFF